MNILLALLLVLPFTISAAELIGITHGEEDVYTHVFCKNCPKKSIQENFVDDLRIEDAGVVVHWDVTGVPKRISVLSPTKVPVRDICGVFLRYWPNQTTTVELFTTYMKRYPCGVAK